ncbi:MAG: outer membrane lipoprotein LolB [Burkholderiaceae bacterium]|uniref:outer membrane lipoprotein LolB n=2 Tax=Ottowia sp. TaxID=1898956 RepID=UPI001DD8FA0A|nr:outer membrane lipoprotein LolB [Ottowia sp.]MCB2023716.1 outer membrane lipoprotein LolB [Ottowia sp.]MCP5257165.1 outer membrane lipoprotein LolB [Burkholderiaceae bacterium]
MLVIAGCASPVRPGGQKDHEISSWSGRMGLTVASEPPLSFSAAFALTGDAAAGELTLTSPLGSTLAVLRWRPGGAVLVQPDGEQHYESVDRLVEQATGAAIPVQALFAWLRGRPEQVPGWQVDLSQLDDGRLVANRQMPLPTAVLRLVLER